MFCVIYEEGGKHQANMIADLDSDPVKGVRRRWRQGAHVKFKRTYGGLNLDRALYLLQTEGTISLTANSSVSSLTS
jgi:hypothetical protein